MSQYYYAVASLPVLKSGEKSPITWERFLEVVNQSITPSDLPVFESSHTGSESPASSEFLVTYKTWDKELRKELAKLRLTRGGFENPTPLPETQGLHNLADTVKSLASKDNPLEAEYQLDGLRWAFLEEMLLGHYFDLEVLLAYSLKLQILQRQELFEKTLGQQNYETTYQTIINNLETNRENV